MQLRTLIGPRAGEVMDFCPQAAYAMLADGRAEMVTDDTFRPPAAGEAPKAAAGREADRPALANPRLGEPRRQTRQACPSEQTPVSLTLVTAPAIEPVTLGQMKLQCGFGPMEDTDQFLRVDPRRAAALRRHGRAHARRERLRPRAHHADMETDSRPLPLWKRQVSESSLARYRASAPEVPGTHRLYLYRYWRQCERHAGR